MFFPIKINTADNKLAKPGRTSRKAPCSNNTIENQKMPAAKNNNAVIRENLETFKPAIFSSLNTVQDLRI
tara:strand:- start:3035 stop:3244 length:210 start_codon:yes stop_codon:yes gene_type:complete